ncbi:hypothetical protein DA718_29455 [Klebsiella huaxiensis]|nr:hypothetical protein DA718_29455 [Klebsiella huaxiensis]
MICWLKNVSHLFYDRLSSLTPIFAVIKIKFSGKSFVIIITNNMIYIVFICRKILPFCVS